MWCITKMVNVYKFHKQLAVTLWTLFKQVKINPPKTGVREPAPGCSYPRWPLSRISSSHDVQKHWAIILGYSQHDGWGRPCAPSVASAAISQKENAAPVHSLHSFLMEMTAPCTHTQTMCGGNRSRLCSTKRRADQWECSYTSQGETTNEKARGPGQKFFFLPPFQGNMPRAIKSASSNWMEKADAPCSGVKRGESRGECLQKRLKASVVQAIKRENAGIRL